VSTAVPVASNELAKLSLKIVEKTYHVPTSYRVYLKHLATFHHFTTICQLFWISWLLGIIYEVVFLDPYLAVIYDSLPVY